MRAILLALSLAGLLAAPVLAKDKAPADPNKKICRHYDTTGSIMGGKTECHTRAEWAQIDQANNDAARTTGDPVKHGARGM